MLSYYPFYAFKNIQYKNHKSNCYHSIGQKNSNYVFYQNHAVLVSIIKIMYIAAGVAQLSSDTGSRTW